VQTFPANPLIGNGRGIENTPNPQRRVSAAMADPVLFCRCRGFVLGAALLHAMEVDDLAHDGILRCLIRTHNREETNGQHD
jgi:hypothetical protein